MTVEIPTRAVPSVQERPTTGDADTPLVRVGIAGIGQQTREHLLPALLGLPAARLRAVVDPAEPARDDLAERLGIRRRYSRVEDLLEAGEVDCVIAACPPQAHEQIAAACLDAGVPVFLEKPPAVTTQGLVALAVQASAGAVVSGVGMNFRWAAPILHLAGLLAGGEYGQVEMVTVRHVASKPRAPMWGMDLWRSFMLAQAIHPIDLLITLAGSPPREVRSGQRLGPDSVTIGVQVEFDNGAIGTLVTGTQAPRFEHRIEVNTTTGVTLSLTDLTDLSIAGAPSSAQGATVRGETRRWRPSPMNVGYDRTGFEGELSAFLTSVSTGRAFTPAFEDLVPTYRLIDQIDPHRSAR